jgi:hypothetical protein
MHGTHTELPRFYEDPALYEDDIFRYLQMLKDYNPIALSSAKKPSLSDYDDQIYDEDSEYYAQQ